jgi:diacylglycerol kinase (ATP)
MRIDVIVNRQAHRLADGSALSDTIARSASGARVHVTRSLDELDGVVRGLARSGTDVVVLAGGDGSYMAGVTALAQVFETVPRLALLPGGTVSTVARNWGYRGGSVRYVRRVFESLRRDEAAWVRRPTLRVAEAGGRARIGFIFGAGLVPKFFELYYGSPRQGYVGAAALVGRIFASSFVGGSYAHRVLDPVACTIDVDGRRREAGAYSLIAASVVPDLGIHMMLTYRAGEALDRFHLVASPLGAFALGPQMPLVLAGRRLRGAGHVDELAGAVDIAFAEPEGAYVLDGEVLRAHELRITPGPTIEVFTV